MAHKPASPGTGFVGPLYLLDKDLEVTATIESTGDLSYVEDFEVGELLVSDGIVTVYAEDATPAAVDDATGGSADDTDWILADVENTGDADPAVVNDNFATLAEVINRILAIIQAEEE